VAEDFYTGNRLKNYCTECGEIDPSVTEKSPRQYCRQCGTRLRTKSAGLALSGGGYRATLFHLGSLWRLNELSWLKRLAEITSVSGGSITAGWLGLRWKKLKFRRNGVADNFVEEIVNPIREFCSHGIEGEAFIAGLARPYRRKLFGKATLQDLPSDKEGPRFTIYATSLQTGVSVRLARPYLADYTLGQVKEPDTELAKAVAASSAFPPIMSPVTLRFKLPQWTDLEGQSDYEEMEKLRKTVVLTDGGVYDNMGLERIWDRYTTVLVSDAGAPFSEETASFWGGLRRLLVTMRVINTVTEQTRRLRRRMVMDEFPKGEVEGAYWGIAASINRYAEFLAERQRKPPLLEDGKETKALCHVRTRLNSFSDKEQEALINWGYALNDAAMRCWVLDKGTKPGHLPYPE
jgi:NTE family protein